MLIPSIKKKSLGQHFLHNRQIAERIVDTMMLQSDDKVVEIGPGAGALTTILLNKLKNLEVIEIDQEVIPFLQKNCHHADHLQIYRADVLKFNFHQFNYRFRLIGNLPYNISTPILFHLTQYLTQIRDMYFMLQKEVAERLVAGPGSKIYGRLSVMMQYYFEVVSIMHIPPTVFTPPPKVDSSLVKFLPRLSVSTNLLLSNIVRDAFGMRRKTLTNSLRKYITAQQLEELGIDPKLRPEMLGVAQFVRIAGAVAKH